MTKQSAEIEAKREAITSKQSSELNLKTEEE
jgi:hypothetical protein